ncbi:M48 family metallopeptidase [Olivibacter sp. CPCC 100613]|uniref:M48 family metallopeptidase n=1 Tax=Olivibacter sp. CPCC 100613 TaxID=3079931 RepID=UPI002FFB74BD
MKTIQFTFFSMLALMCLHAQAQFKVNTKSIKAATTAAKAVTLSDDEVIGYAKEYMVWMDENNPVAPDDDELAQRLAKLTSGLTDYDGLNLNFKVYLVRDVNAFACADGSVRVCAGLMQVMDDNEVLGVIGHEIGHVKNKDSKDAFRTALLSSALKDGVGSQGGTAGALSDSKLGELGTAVANSSFSRSQESAADLYGYALLRAQDVNPWYMATAFESLAEQSEGAEKASTMQRLMSSHPDTEKRIKVMSEKATKEGFEKPAK